MAETTSFRAVPAGLLLLIAVPVTAGAVRLAQLARGAAITPQNARFFAQPLPVVLHIVCASTFCVLGVFQFAPRLRRRSWHRIAGRVIVPCGVVAVLSGLWMSLFYPRPPGDGDLLAGLRLVFGSAMAASLVLGFLAVRRRDYRQHRAWMLRGYAIGMGAGTQVFTSLPWAAATGHAATGTPRALLLGAGWVINLAVAERIIGRTRRVGGAVAAGAA
jgi:uncharacterized membrane protein